MTNTDWMLILFLLGGLGVLGKYLHGDLKGQFRDLRGDLKDGVKALTDLSNGLVERVKAVEIGLESLRMHSHGGGAGSPPLFVQKSPYRLTDEGRRFLEETGLRQVIDGRTSELDRAITGHAQQRVSKVTSDDRWESALSLLMDFYDTDYMAGVRERAYQSGVSRAATVMVAAIYLLERIDKDLPARA